MNSVWKMYSNIKIKINEYNYWHWKFLSYPDYRKQTSRIGDTDYEYMHTDEAPIEEQKAEFKRNVRRKYLHIRHTQAFLEQK